LSVYYEENLFNLAAKLGSIATWHDCDEFKAILNINIELLLDKKCISSSDIEKLKKIGEKIIVNYEKDNDNPNIEEMNLLLDKFILITMNAKKLINRKCNGVRYQKMEKNACFLSKFFNRFQTQKRINAK